MSALVRSSAILLYWHDGLVGTDVWKTDDVGIFCSPVSNEYLLAASHFGLGRGDILRLCRKGVGAIFGGDEEKKRLWGLLDEFEGVELVGSLCLFAQRPAVAHDYRLGK